MKNYLSLWIANLGVDPTLAILFFLFLPAFFFLRSLLLLVCIVLDAISISLRSLFLNLIKIRPVFLSIMALFVKIFLLSSNYVVIAAANKEPNIKDLFISKGEQITLSIKELNHYSIGNKEVIKHIYKKSLKQLYIKGKSIGFTDLIIITKSKKFHYHVYVTSKRSQLKKIHIAQMLKKMSLEVTLNGEFVYASGEVNTISDYLRLHHVQKLKQNYLILDVKLSNELKKILFAKFYNIFYSQGATKVICNSLGIHIECMTEDLDLTKTIIKQYKEKYQLILNSNLSKLKFNNYILKYKIIQVESIDSSQNKIALSKISWPLLDLIQTNTLTLIEGETTKVGVLNINATLLSEPQVLLSLNEKSEISLGGEIPFNSRNLNEVFTEWRFFGLKIKSNLINKNGKPYIKFDSTLTTPQENVIEGTKGKGGIYLSFKKYLKLFEIGHEFTKDEINSIPYLNKIPILRHLFTSSSKSKIYKHIICFVSIEEANE